MTKININRTLVKRVAVVVATTVAVHVALNALEKKLAEKTEA